MMTITDWWKLTQDIKENLPHVKFEDVRPNGAVLSLDTPSEDAPKRAEIHPANESFSVTITGLQHHQVMQLLESVTRRMDE